MKKFILLLLVCSVISSVCITANAHSSLQGSIISWGESIGWSIDESYHTNTLTVKYEVGYLSQSVRYRNYISEGADKWRSLITFTESSSNPVGEIYSKYIHDNPDAFALFTNPTANSSGHLTSWEIQINDSNSDDISSAVLAHEFGHVIGLNDLYASNNRNKLMYPYEARTVSSPTSYDITGARVILGLHTTHSFTPYSYYDTTSSGSNRHYRECTVCDGYKISLCTYRSNVCTLCGIPRGQTIMGNKDYTD